MPAKELGQYFTPENVADFMVGLIQGVARDAPVLEPACGEGVFLRALDRRGYRNLVGYEVDRGLRYDGPDCVRYESFVSADLGRKFAVVIGNPPYVRWKNLTAEAKRELRDDALWQKYCNALCDYLYVFILKSVEALEHGGRLIFITPSNWLSSTHGQPLRDYMAERGSFESLWWFRETPLFAKVASSLVIFSYVKGRGPLPAAVYEYGPKNAALSRPDCEFVLKAFESGRRWCVARPSEVYEFERYERGCRATLGEVADIGNGLVSGLDKAFCIPEGVVLNPFEEARVLLVGKAKDLRRYRCCGHRRYMDAADVDSEDHLRGRCPHFFGLLEPHRDQLKRRYAYGRDLNYWHWAFPRNRKLFGCGRPRILVPCKERITHKDYFRFALVGPKVFPTQDAAGVMVRAEADFREGVHYLLGLLNTRQVFQWVKHNGVVKGGLVEFTQNPLGRIPVRRVDWGHPEEVRLHGKICDLVRRQLAGQDVPAQIQTCFDALLAL